ncbi:2-C-methyl-D-erythritol 4-phosphate cytidylyltransferase [Clostridium intestinale]|jgi:2-C-methyl-D-erythritol 4-phosphate cytidylyltransferase|uniref:2-C-methyl-D-erythritol 4-phosphate cytidylyltransferase n=2 Tax=Clostridium intestinale TaxID=36845 RepID=U2NAM2_9CLOT|nr:2-C-methyl-D-erythritol 4-phosphate cytidylyltransferase [Clostridium intestinale]ERK32542.1 2-C-methyl-D-erythritol 4-phosphate cytidylyltransferase [Clostridium intestinale URNW]QLY79562.1 2-C-methyl-D-erythritol 4-phosphate cytidylyltransferase [Clostridium intestinale]
MNKVSAIILAGGKGKRMGNEISKQFLDLKKKPMLYYTLKKFLNNGNVHEIILVLPEDEIDYCKEEILDKYELKVDRVVVGGKERSDSVYNGLKAIEDSSIVLIHDGARPFVSNRIIDEGIDYAKRYGATACGVTPKDTIKIVDNSGFSKETPDRSTLIAIQTPQTFDYKMILEAHEWVREKNLTVTDDTMVAEAYGKKVFIYEGDYTNIKITTPDDLILAERLV